MTRSLLILALLILVGCDSTSGQPDVRVGARATFGEAEARTWVRLAADGTPDAVGVTFGADALDALLADHTPMPGDPMHGMFELPLDLPDVDGLPFDHVGLDWNPMGHEPPGLFDKPHVDVHFYLLTPAERDAISPADPAFEDKLARRPADRFIPAGYVPTPGGVPRMGAHWIDTADPTYAPGGSFTEVLIYGFYDGAMAFVEPMITNDFVAARNEADEAIAQPAAFPEPGFYPTRYTSSFDAEANEYSVVLEGFVRRN